MLPKYIKKEILNDELTPILCFKAVGGAGCCLLESAHERNEGKTSLIGIHPIAVFRSQGSSISIESSGKKEVFEEDPYEALKRFSKDRKAFGTISYDGDFFFRLYKTIIVFDHDRQTITYTHEGTEEELDNLIDRCREPIRLKPLKNRKKIDFQVTRTREEHAEMIEKGKKYIRAGAVFQIVLSRVFSTPVQASSFDIYRAIRQTSPAPYLFYFEEKDSAIAGASPELLISVQNGRIESMPIAGTTPRGSVEDLLADPKECAEHVMLVDLARNDVGSVSEIGTVKVVDFRKIHTFSHVNHIVSRVEGKLKASLHPLDALKASFPAGTLSGAPKIRAMELIEELEQRKRGLYGGAIVSIDENGHLISCLAIRMVQIRNGFAEIQAGGGIVLESDGIKEALETEHKSRGVREAIELAEGGVS